MSSNCKHEELIIVGKGPENCLAWFIECTECGSPVRKGGRVVGPAHAEGIVVNGEEYEFAGIELENSQKSEVDNQ